MRSIFQRNKKLLKIGPTQKELNMIYYSIQFFYIHFFLFFLVGKIK